MGRVQTVGRGIIRSAADNLLTADYSVISRVAQLKAKLLHQRGDYNLVILIKRQAAHQL
jgi:hypothetical protein